MQTRTLDLVRAAFINAERPLTIKELVLRTELSTGTVTAALVKLNSTSDLGHPARWSIPAVEPVVDDATKLVVESLEVLPGRTPILIGYTADPPNPIVTAYNMQVPMLKKHLKLIEASDDVDTMIHQFTIFASSFATIAWHLTQAKDKPEWFSLLTEPEAS